MSKQWDAERIRSAIASAIEWWRHMIVPNVYLGGGLDEMDLAIVSISGLLWEVEIKVSRADWKADTKKGKWRRRGSGAELPARFYYAVPHTLLLNFDPAEWRREMIQKMIPEWVRDDAGVIVLYESGGGVKARLLRQAKAQHRMPLPENLRWELARKLGQKYWRHVSPNIKGEAMEISA